MKKTISKGLAFLCALCMIASLFTGLVPVQASANEEVLYSEDFTGVDSINTLTQKGWYGLNNTNAGLANGRLYLQSGTAISFGTYVNNQTIADLSDYTYSATVRTHLL